MFMKILTYGLLVLAFVGAVVVFSANYNSPWQHFTTQANSFLQFKTDIPQPDHDYVFLNGKYYWPQGPFPSVLLIPFLKLFGPDNFNQGPMQLYLIVALIYFLSRLEKIKGFNFKDGIFLTMAFLVGSSNTWIFLDSKSAFYAQVVTLTFLTVLLYELETRKDFGF